MTIPKTAIPGSRLSDDDVSFLIKMTVTTNKHQLHALLYGLYSFTPSSPAAACGGGSHAGATPPFHEVCGSWEGGQGDNQGAGSGGRSPRAGQARPSSARPVRPSPAHPSSAWPCSPRLSSVHPASPNYNPASARPSSARPVGASPASGVEFNKLSRVDRRAHVLRLIYKHQEQQRGRQTFF